MDRFRQMVAQGHLRPGDRFPPERELAAQFGVSRASVREAFSALETLGFIENRPGEGKVVVSTAWTGLMDLMALYRTPGGSLVNYLLEPRLALEGMAAARAAERRTVDDLADIGDALAVSQDRLHRGQPLFGENNRFHLGVARAAGNPVLAQLLDMVLGLCGDALAEDEQNGLGQAGPALLAQHQAVYQALVDRDPAAARLAMESHLQFVHDAVRSGEVAPAPAAGGEPNPARSRGGSLG